MTAASCPTGPLLAANEQFFIDPLNVFLVALTAFVGLTTSIFSRPYMRVEQDHGNMTPARMRLYHSMYQLFSFTMLPALTTNNMGILWVAMEAATLTTVLLVSVYRTAASLEAAWKYFILCGVGIAQALFGTILLYLAAEQVFGAEGGALLWTHLDRGQGPARPEHHLARVRVPVHRLRHQGRPRPAAQLAARRARRRADAGLGGALRPAPQRRALRAAALQGARRRRARQRARRALLMGFGLVSVVVAAFFLSRQKDVKRMFAYSSIEHMGLITFAFGLGGPIANFAGLLHMTVHSLAKSAIFFAVGHAAQKAGTQVMDDIRGLIKVSPTVGWGLMLGSLAILGMPPFGVFASEFLILTTAMREQPWATPFLLLALGVAFASVFGRVLPMVFGETDGQAAGAPAGAAAGVRPSGARPDARPLRPALSRRLVPPRRRGMLGG